ncbi:MAG: VWA domain-containing protein [Pirellulaceae bacterium]|nr:VWA domain-containing protein [Pirellulaceae bacterium]
MGHWQIGFEYPMYWGLILLVPWIWWLGQQSLAGLGATRQWIAILLRCAVLILVIAALAGVHWIWISDRTSVIYLLDQSDSIPAAKRQLMLRYAIESTKQHRRANRQDRAGMIIFSREASIEFAPLDENLPPISQPESYLGESDATNIESAMKLAQASFPENSARRIVILTDGNETLGTASATAKRLSENGIGIDIIPIHLDSTSEVLIEKIDIPGQVRQGQPVEARVVIQRYTEGPHAKDVEGRLRVTRRVGNQTETVADGPVTLDQEVNVIPIPHRVDQPAGYTYEAEFIPDSPSADSIPQNNRTTAFTYARGKGRVMLIENSNNVGRYDPMVDALRRSDIEVEVRDTSNLFTSLIELQGYDSVILAGVARTVGDDASNLQSFSDDQIESLVQSVQQFGTGLLMLGGPEAFGAGGWSNTRLEEAMPVDFQIKNAKINAVGALAMVMHASEMAQGNYWQKSIARSALNALGPMDYCGVVQYDMSGNSWMWGGRTGMVQVGPNRSIMQARMSRMTPGDMPDFDSSLNMALNSLKVTPASIKHMIVISDGDPTPPSRGLLNGYRSEGIKISTVAVGTHGPAGSNLLQSIATDTGGNYYVASNPKVLPQIFMKEARRVARPLIFEPEGGVQPEITFSHEAMTGIASFPPLKGFVLTQRKENPLVEVPLLSPAPNEPINASILATWTYGLGRTAVFTSDGTKLWTPDWVSWPQYDQFFSQLVRWTMRPTVDDGKYQVATQTRDGKVQVIVTAMDQEDRLVNFLEMSGVAIGPDLKPHSLSLKQKAPGRYVGEFDIVASGAYILNIIPAPGKAPLTSGVTVPFSDEYRVRHTNRRLLEELAGLTPVGGTTGRVMEPLENESLKQLVSDDPFRSDLQKARSLEDVWPLAILLGAILFFSDVFVRRVSLDAMLPIRWIFTKFSNRETAADSERRTRLERLRSSKSDVADELDRQKASATFAPTDDALLATQSAVEQFSAAAPPSNTDLRPDMPLNLSSPDKDEVSYTARLLEAKRRAQSKKEP